MQIKLLNDVISDVAGKQGSDILQLLIGKKDVNEFIIAKKLKLTINQVRNILYKLSNFSLVTFTRKKDRRKGWYTYFWTLDDEKALELLNKKLENEMTNLKQHLKSRKIKRFYFCKTCKTEVSEENALLHEFTCPECGEVYELADNSKITNELEKEINKLDRQKENVMQELDKIKKEKGKKRDKDMRRELKKKQKERAKKAKLRKKEKKKVEKAKSSKKKIKKSRNKKKIKIRKVSKKKKK